MSEALPRCEPPPLRLVLDTNVVLDLIFWRDPSVRGLEAALRSGAALAIGEPRCLDELRDVLQRPQFARADIDPLAVYEGYASLCEPVGALPAGGPALAPLPRCRDASDQKFLELARRAGADLLVSRDKALLALARKRYGDFRFRIVNPAQAEALLASRESACSRSLS